jgi:hypothetical protein
MAMDLNLVRQEATTAVTDALAELYKEQEVDRAALEGFAGAVAEAAVAAIAHVLARAELGPNSEGLL